MNAEQERELMRSAGVGMATLRVWCGVWFLLMTALKLPLWGADWDFPARLAKWLEMAAERGAHPQYRALLKPLIAHAGAVTGVVAFLEGGIGLMLVLGLFTRAASIGAIFLYTNYWLASARLGYASAGMSLMIAVTAACLWIGNAGLFYGLDGVRERRRSSSLAPPMTARS